MTLLKNMACKVKRCEHLAEMKIPAKSPSSTLEDAYGNGRKKLCLSLRLVLRRLERNRLRLKRKRKKRSVLPQRLRQSVLLPRSAVKLSVPLRRRSVLKKRLARRLRLKKSRPQAEAERKAAEEAERERSKIRLQITPSFSDPDQIAQQEEVCSSRLLSRLHRRKSEKSQQKSRAAKG